LRRIALANVIGLLAVLLGTGCAWVSLTPEGETVRVLAPAQAAGCQGLGHTTSQTTGRVLMFARVERTVNEELDSLARNEAARMGGDAVVPRGAVEDGRRSFDVYRCGSR
jgi:hypothetical protein